MAVFYSFHYERDVARVMLVRNLGAIEGQPLLNPQEWEQVRRGGKPAIEKWIDEQMAYKTAVVVLVGAETANRHFVNYEIIKAWTDKRPLVGIRIHGLSSFGNVDSPGANPFAQIKLADGGNLGQYIPLHDPVGRDSQQVHSSISDNLKTWVSGAYKRS